MLCALSLAEVGLVTYPWSVMVSNHANMFANNVGR